MAHERPPRGYDRHDFPLPHYFTYEFGLDSTTETKNATIATYLRTSKISVDPTTIEVNPRHTDFAVDTGPLICEESIVDRITIKKSVAMSAAFIAQVPAVTTRELMIKGCFEDTWSPTDEKTTTSIEDIVEVTNESTTNMDVTPKFSGTDLFSEENQPLSTITGAESVAHYNLTTDAKLESVAWNAKTYFDAKRYYTNGAKLNTVAPNLITNVLNAKRKNYMTSLQTKFVPPQCRFGRRDLFLGSLFDVPLFSDPDQVINSFVAAVTEAHVIYEIIVMFNEWNPAFDQKSQ